MIIWDRISDRPLDFEDGHFFVLDSPTPTKICYTIYYNMLQYATICYNMLQYTIICYRML